MRKDIWILVIIISLSAAGMAFVEPAKIPVASISNFDECEKSGGLILESYPAQCLAANERIFTQDVGNEIEKQDLIRLTSPRPGQVLRSPFTITGEARGYWFFEASFPVKLLDSGGNEIARGVAQAEGEWMTTEFVPFEAMLTFVLFPHDGGTLLLEKENPSELPEHTDALRIPVRFEMLAAQPPAAKTCIVTGCSGQICADEEVITTCEFRAEYACYKNARCERQSSEKCEWIETEELRACVDKAK